MVLIKKYNGASLGLFLVLLSGTMARAQNGIHVSDPELELKDQVVYIQYDILNSSQANLFEVDIEITDADGKKIRARALEGDIGKDIKGGRNKLITWDLEKDQFFINSEVFVKINAKLTNPPENESSVDNNALAIEPAKAKTKTRSGLVLQSIVFPGLGLSRYTGDPHWIKGAAGYGFIAGSVIFNLQARNTYRSIEEFPEFTDKQDLLDQSIRQDNISTILGIAAIGIWLTDIVWTVRGTSSLPWFSAGSSIDPLTHAPLLSLRYRF